MPTAHTTTVSQDRLTLLYTIVKGLAIDVGKVTEKEIRECAIKKQKSTALLFPSLITGICEAFKVKFEASNERVKNKKFIIAKTVEMIDVESITAVTLEQATRIEQIMQELSDSINACVQA